MLITLSELTTDSVMIGLRAGLKMCLDNKSFECIVSQVLNDINHSVNGSCLSHSLNYNDKLCQINPI